MTYIFLRTQKKCGIFIQLVIWQEKCHYAMFCDKNLDHLVLPKLCMMILFNIFYCLCVNVWVEVYYVKILVNTSNKVFFLIKKNKRLSHGKKKNNCWKLLKMWRKGSTCAFLMGMQIAATTIENYIEFSQNIKNKAVL